MRFLIDECLHTSLVEVALLRGFEAAHVNHRGLSGAKDWELLLPIRAGGFSFVTNNARDFRRLFAREAIHSGLIILLPQVPPALQRILFDAALDAIGDGLINEALEVNLAAGEIEIVRYRLRS